MTDSVKEQIVKHLVARLATITTANGYANTIASVQRYSLHGLSVASVPVLYVNQGEDLVQSEKRTFPNVWRSLELFIAVITRTDDSESRSGDEVLTSLCSDVERCVMADGTHGGLALKTASPDWMECTVDVGIPHLAMALKFTVDYRHHVQHPEQVA